MKPEAKSIASQLAAEMGVTYNDVVSFARAVANELEKDKVSTQHIDGPTGAELVSAYLEPAIRTQERFRLVYQTKDGAREAFAHHIYSMLTKSTP